MLERIINTIPDGYKEPIFKQMKRKVRRFCARYNWDETKIRDILLKSDDWTYCWPFCND